MQQNSRGEKRKEPQGYRPGLHPLQKKPPVVGWEAPRQDVALEVLRSFLGMLLRDDRGTTHWLEVVSHWTRYPPFPDCGPAESFEYLVEKLLFGSLELEFTTDHVQLFRDAPQLRLPHALFEEDTDLMALLAEVVRHSEQLFRQTQVSKLEHHVTLRSFRFDQDLSLLESFLPREKLLMDVVLRYLVGAHASGEQEGPGFTNMVLQMRACVERLHAAKLIERTQEATKHELPGVASLRQRHLGHLYMLDRVLRMPKLYEWSRKTFEALRSLDVKRQNQQELSLTSSSSSSLDRLGRMRDMSRLLHAMPTLPAPGERFVDGGSIT